MLLIFDWDGTLIDSTTKIVNCVRATAQSLGVEPPSKERAQSIIGLGLREAIVNLYPQFDLDSEEVTRFCEFYSRQFVAADAKPCEFFPGVIQTLEQLKADGFRLAVATGKSRRGLDRILAEKGVGHLFDHSRCADETRSKPNPQMLHELLALAGVGHRDAVMVGDTSFDMEMAAAIAMPKIAVSYGAHSVAQLELYQPDHIVHAFSEIEPIIASMFAKS